MRLIDADAYENEMSKAYGDDWDKLHILESMPTVEQKHGHWYVDEQKNIWGDYVNCQVCSVCNKRNIVYDRQSNYCPNCGAKMDEVTE